MYRLTSRRKVVTTDASNSGWGTLLEGILLLVSPVAMPAYQLLRAVGCFPGPDSHKEAPCPSLFRQHDGGSLYQPTRWSQAFLQDDSRPLIVGTEKTPLAKSGSCARQFEPRCGHAVQRQCSSGKIDFNPQMVQRIWSASDLPSGGRDRPLHLRRQLSLPNLFLNAARCSGPWLAQC